MDKKRRRVLKLTGSMSVATLAGCTTSNNADSETSPEEQSEETSVSTTVTETSTATQTQTTTLTTTTPTPTSTQTQTTTSDSPDSQSAKLVANDGQKLDEFGTRVAISGDGSTAIITATRDDNSNGENAGSAYIFSQSAGSWSQQAKLVADDGNSDDFFGRSVAVTDDGSAVFVASDRASDPNRDGSGTVYVFSRESGSWTQRTKLIPDSSDEGSYFGTSVSVTRDGSTALITDAYDRDGAGSAYVFSQDGETWHQQAKLVAEDGDKRDSLGVSGAITDDGSTAIITAPGDEDPNGARAGSAYVFYRNDSSWRQQAKLVANDGKSEDYFGSSVALADDGSAALISAPQNDAPRGDLTGAVYVFSQNSSSWSQQKKLTSDDGSSEGYFGRSVAINGNGSRAFITGAESDNPVSEFGGSTYVFSQEDGSWNLQKRLYADEESTELGNSVAVTDNGSIVLTGAKAEDDPIGDNAGVAYIFE